MARPKRKQDSATFSLFEENYLVRALGRIAQDPEVALTDLVANAWDTGASLVDLTIPPTRDLVLSVEDDGNGMTSAQITGRWMKLAYGRNGVGRHGLLCFADRYQVEAWCEGKGGTTAAPPHHPPQSRSLGNAL